MSEIRFGTDGWRAIIAKDFTFYNCRVVTQGIAGYLTRQKLTKKGIVIGYDHRFMSRQFAQECARVLMGNGVKVFLYDKAVPTPVTAFATRALNAGGAIMITASHNPPEYNGIKFIPEYAGPAMPDVTEAIEAEINRVLEGSKLYELDLDEADKLGLFKEINLDHEYIKHLQNLIQTDCFKERKLKVVVDPMYGAGAGYLEKILSGLGCEVVAINNHRDVLFGGLMPEPIDHLLADLKRAVFSYNADIGLALDGDADRFGIIDHNGDFVTANRFMYILLNHLLATRTFRGPVIRTVATTHMLDRIARKNGLSVIETPVGFKYIGEGLREKGCIMGGEESGGLSIFGHIPEKDGILAGLLAAEMLACSGKNLVELTEEVTQEYGSVVSQRLDIKVKEQERATVQGKLVNYSPKSICGTKVESISELEGKKVLLEDGSWVLVRSSGTEPLFRVYVEAGDQKQLEEIALEVIKALGLNTAI